jgi:hypothetical protein
MIFSVVFLTLAAAAVHPLAEELAQLTRAARPPPAALHDEVVPLAKKAAATGDGCAQIDWRKLQAVRDFVKRGGSALGVINAFRAFEHFWYNRYGTSINVSLQETSDKAVLHVCWDVPIEKFSE